jgi:tRNA A-37 threonylcarbamoyl transferase component Bud32
VGNGAARVWTREGDGGALDLARQYLANSLQGLARVPSAATARVHRAEHLEPVIYFKEYLHRDGLDPLKQLLRPSRAHRALRAADTCRRAGFRAPRPVCLIETGPRRRPSRSILATEAFENAPCLRDWIAGRAGRLAPARRRGLLREVGRLVGTWHACGMFHGDLHPGNLLCRPEGDGMAFCFLDIERTRRYRRLPLRARVNDLVKLNYERLPVTLADRMRVWDAYLEAAGWPREAGRGLRRRVAARTRARWREAGWL